MKPKFTFNQFIVKKAREVRKYLWYDEETDKVSYGVFKVTPYTRIDVEGNPYPFGIEYKVRLVPVGESAEKFRTMDYYTTDLGDIPKEMIFDNVNLAEKFVKEFPIENVK